MERSGADAVMIPTFPDHLDGSLTLAWKRFHTKIQVDDATGCWLWTGWCNASGYGVIKVNGCTVGTHRLAWIFYKDEIEDDMQVLHHCDTPPCCNPEHLFIGTNADNVRDRHTKGRTAPKHGTLNGRAKLTEDDVRLIRKLSSEGKTRVEIASMYDLTPEAISCIALRKTWQDVD
jgi:hypothetical protein